VKAVEPAEGLPAVEYAERSDPGRDPEKQVNEDTCGHRATRFGHLCVVCDGMGGHAAGREAAELAVATVFEVFERAAADTPPGKLLVTALEEASRRIHVMRTSEVALGRPGSTAVAVLMHAGGTEVAHVGDSRVYLVHEGQIVRMTRDHSIVQELVDRGLLTPGQAAHHPDANRITRALGMSADVHAELRPQPVHHVVGDAFVLCSDGLSDLVEDGEILAIVGAEPAAQAVGKLVDLANARGGHDNVTVIVLRARETASGTGTGVSQTLAQTAAPPITVPGAAPTPTVIETTGDRGTEPTLAPAVLLAAPAAHAVRPRRRASPAVIVGVVLAGAALALLGLLLIVHIQERSGKRNTPTTLPLPTRDPSSPSAAASVPLVPEAVVVPAASERREPIVPLLPSPSPSKKR
jgi:serine/threonine protein phosphatase PrpC